jgi:hypothetical protein
MFIFDGKTTQVIIHTRIEKSSKFFSLPAIMLRMLLPDKRIAGHLVQVVKMSGFCLDKSEVLSF